MEIIFYSTLLYKRCYFGYQDIYLKHKIFGSLFRKSRDNPQGLPQIFEEWLSESFELSCGSFCLRFHDLWEYILILHHHHQTLIKRNQYNQTVTEMNATEGDRECDGKLIR